MDCQLSGTAFQSGVSPDPASPGHCSTSPRAVSASGRGHSWSCDSLHSSVPHEHWDVCPEHSLLPLQEITAEAKV